LPFPIVRKIKDEEERLAVIEAAKGDNDNMQFPTHVVMKGDEIVGGWCMGAIPLVLMWNKSTSINAKESMILNNVASAMMNDRGTGMYFMACNENSPYIGHMEKFGFLPVWPTNIFYKRTN